MSYNTFQKMGYTLWKNFINFFSLERIEEEKLTQFVSRENEFRLTVIETSFLNISTNKE